MAYDASRGRVVLLGDVDADRFCGDTWVLDSAGGTWTLLGTSALPTFYARAFHGMTYDTRSQSIQVFGGIGAPLIGQPVQQLDDMWEFSGATWTRIPKAGAWPTARSWTAPTYEAARNRTVLYAG